MPRFGEHIRRRRESLRRSDPQFSVRRVARRIGVEPSYLSKVERDLEAPPSEAKIQSLALVLGEDADALLALAGKVASDLTEAIRRRPHVFPRVIRQLKDLPDRQLLRAPQAARSSADPKESP